jgi:hypothetical protein
MAKPELKIITRLVTQHRSEISCLTAGEHAAARTAAPAAGISVGDVMEVLAGIADLCQDRGWDFRALARRIQAGDGSPAPA